jgi:hypothetical protein
VKAHPLSFFINPSFEGSPKAICEVLREIYRLTEKPDVHLRVAIAYDMAKKMDETLRRQRKALGKPDKELFDGDS